MISLPIRICTLSSVSILAGAYCKEVPPVPFPNTAVKLFRDENTWLVTTWEISSVPAFKAPSFDGAFLFIQEIGDYHKESALFFVQISHDIFS